ncbi:pullulanase-type alpha-1,6-glucosidase, partial [Aliiglaciecola lipolytica]|uniref:pullulanase-type alpha-1,6-glucosidase n=1 Tax=Aliiglaciecola lipolytica TaxID=477689 RepID=UPI00129C1BA7
MKHYIFIYSMSLLITLTLAACGSTSSGKRSGKPIELEFAVNTLKPDAAAHWVKPNLILLAEKKSNPALIFSNNASIDESNQADSLFNLVITEMPAWVSTELPHLAKFYAYNVAIPTSEIKSKLKQQAAVIGRDEKAKVTSLSYVQSAKLLDALYTSSADDANELDNYGALIIGDITRFTLWAPTAIDVKVRLFDKYKNPLESGIITLSEDPQTGAWSGITSHAPQGTFYRYQIEVYHPQSKRIERLQVTDPYSLSLSTNSVYSQVVDLASAHTQPNNWASHDVPTIDAPESLVLYETHIRDFSASDTSLSDPQLAGKYAAFSQAHSDSINHLKALKKAGLNTVHLLPTYDISTVDEIPSNVISMHDTLQKVCSLAHEVPICQTDYNPTLTLQALLNSFDVSSSETQEIIELIRAKDAYNWGYDPFHYTVPEGSYALNPEGIPRLIEFRQMVMRLHQLGFRVIMDVVYNHTFAAGLAEKSVLDKVVPNYYHRLNPITGTIEQSTCCENSATEQVMMAKLMTDSLVTWAKHYKIDGFRFDLMGHQPKVAMLKAREAVRMVDADTYFYGEGWNFGEVANNQQFIQASQTELAGTEIGTFTDRLRDAIRGGSSFLSGDDIRKGQGLGNGLEVFPNELHYQIDPQSVREEYLLSMDQARIGLAGNLAIFPLENAQGQRVFGR